MAPPRRSSRGQTKSTKDTNTQSTAANAKTSKPKTTRKSAREVISNLRSTRASTRDKQSDKDENNDSDSDASEPSNKRKASLRSRETKDKDTKSEKKASLKELSENESDEEQSIPDAIPAKKPKTSIAEESDNENDNVTQEPEITETNNEQITENNNSDEKESTKTSETLPLEPNNTSIEEKTSPDSGVTKENPLKPTNTTNDLTLPAGLEELKNNQTDTNTESAKTEPEVKQSTTIEDANTYKGNQSKETEAETDSAKCIVSDRPDEVRFVPESTMVVNFELNSKDLKSRLSKFQELKSRMNRSSQENHKELMLEHERSLVNPKLEAKYQRKYEEAKKLLEKTEAEERGDNYDRNQYWNYSVESVEKWDEKQAIKNERAQNGFTDYAQAAQKKYDRLTNSIKPNLAAYQQNMSQTNIPPTTSGSGYTHSPNYENKITTSHTHVNRPSNVIYGPHTFHSPSNDSADRLAQFVRQEQASRSQSSKHRKANEDDEINYINDRNQKFNQKIARAYDQHTEDIRESFERGTAL